MLSEVVKIMWKKIFACMLCLIIVAVPFVQRTHAVVTTASLAAVLILTVMVAMGITLVVAEASKEDFILNKGSSFMTAKGYSGSFSDWILAGTETEIGLKTGFLLLSKTVVDNIKEFVDWLIPGAASDTVHDLSTSEGVLVDSALLYHASVDNGSLVINSIGVYPQEGYTSSDRNTFTDGINEVYFYMGRNGTWGYTGYYDSTTGVRTADARSWSSNLNYRQILVLISTSFTISNVTHLPGIYTASVNISHSPVSYDISYDRYYLQASAAEPDNVMDASAVIGNYNDLDDLTDNTIVGSGGTTTVSNTFYITTDGQALDPATQDLADILDALRQALENQNQKTEVTGWTAATAAEGEVTPDYTDFDLGKLDFNGLRALITTRFPFCIPWDFVRIIELFVAEPEAPHWEVDLLPIDALDGIDTTVSLDLGDYPIVGTVSRWFCIIDLCLGLVFCTKKLIWTA